METGPIGPDVHISLRLNGPYSTPDRSGGVCTRPEPRMYLAVAFRYSTGLIEARRASTLARWQASSHDAAVPSANVTPVLLRVPVTL